MRIPCISCNSMFRLDSRFTNPTGSLVRCSNCHFIFIVHPQEFNDRPKTQDTNIDQSILDDLFKMEHAVRTKLPLKEISEEWNIFFAQGALSIEDFEEKVAEDPNSNTVDTGCTDLPDLSEYENMIDWEDNTDSEQPQQYAVNFNKRTPFGRENAS